MQKLSKPKTSRAAILPYPGDPFLFAYWYRFFKNVWSIEVDKLYVYLNSPIEQDVVSYIKSLVAKDPKVVLTYHPAQLEHGEVINRALDLVTEDYVMLIEDDGLIFHYGAVEQAFNMVESGAFEIVGSKRGSCSQEILNAARDKWGLNYEGEGDQGPNFWPCFFFCKKELLLKTDRQFGARAWKRGEVIEPLGYTVQDEVCASDTFVNTSLQLHALVPNERIYYVPQYHVHPLDLDHFAEKKSVFDGRAPWLHIGSLSSGVGGILQDEYSRPLARRTIDPQGNPTKLNNPPQDDFTRQEWERRVQWWLMFYWNSPPIGLAEFKRLYKEAIDRVVEQYSLNRDRITRRMQIFGELVTSPRVR